MPVTDGTRTPRPPARHPSSPGDGRAGAACVSLDEILTIREIAQRWQRHPRTVRRGIDARRRPLEARQSPDDARGIWLITRASVVRRWGDPPEND